MTERRASSAWGQPFLRGTGEHMPKSDTARILLWSGLEEARRRTRKHLESKARRQRWVRRAVLAGVLLTASVLFGLVASGLGMLAGLLMAALLKTLERL